MFEKCNAQIVELRFQILNTIMDDAEDVEQVYLSMNRDEFLKELQPCYALRDIFDEMKLMLETGYIRVYSSNDEIGAPLENVNFTPFHHYWFLPTDAGKDTWQKASARKA